MKTKHVSKCVFCDELADGLIRHLDDYLRLDEYVPICNKCSENMNLTIDKKLENK